MLSIERASEIASSEVTKQKQPKINLEKQVYNAMGKLSQNYLTDNSNTK